jgi:glycerol-3-phosphate dehydrogenase
MKLKISIIGAGNMAFRLGIALRDAGHNITKVWCRRRDAGEKLATILSTDDKPATYTDNLSDTIESELIILAISDNAINNVASRLAQEIGHSPLKNTPVVIHTSGATEMDALSPLTSIGVHCGVIWPMMTLSKNKNINFGEVPLII